VKEFKRLKVWYVESKGEEQFQFTDAVVMHGEHQDLVRDFKERIQELEAVLEAVRSQMCWERDRDQLSMGMSDLHDDVTKVLGKDET